MRAKQKQLVVRGNLFDKCRHVSGLDAPATHPLLEFLSSRLVWVAILKVADQSERAQITRDAAQGLIRRPVHA
jgi:hypothetical protein